ncbi:Hypothetical protein, predicted transmembrane protein [Metamycoplasma auris 15026]|uniref:Uncharacterized protein n=1 Tax=Metamycoplasma auris 15026 TaxID=1188233 RepID=N9VA05_9BACT|nr:hypothetical protein [Metamycoplasma auris]ENY68533.1 Hypothetical protein, predicted transmembrane protein [Metamycoplasma auris 15026]
MEENIETKKTTSNLDWNNIFDNPVKQVYDRLVGEYENACERVFQKYIVQNNEETNNLVANNVKDINRLQEEISNEKNRLKITKRQIQNGFILFFCFLVFGLFFLKFFISNNKIIHQFNDFKNARMKVIYEKINQNKNSFVSLFNRFSFTEWKSKILEELDINKINQINPNEFKFLIEKDGFYSYDAIEKYQVRNSCYYDILYTKEYWKNVITSNQKWVTIQTKDGPITRLISASHVEPTPFSYKKHIFVLPTNYKPNLNILENDKNLSKKDYDKLLKEGKFLLENPELYQYYNFAYNDKIGFIDYFKVKTQENFIEYAKHLKSRYPFGKIKNAIFASRNYEASLLPYSEEKNWFEKANLVNLYKPITLDYTFKIMCNLIKEAIIPIFKSISQAYLNINIASEVYKGNDRYLSDYYYEKSPKNNSSDTYLNIYDLINKTIKLNPYFFTTASPAKHIGIGLDSYITDEKENINSALLTLRMFSYWKEELIDSVWKNNEVIDVPYVKYHPLVEKKQLLYIRNYRFETNKKELYSKYIFYNDKRILLSNLNLIINELEPEAITSLTKVTSFDEICDLKLIDAYFEMYFDSDGLFIFINRELDEEEMNRLLNYFSINIETNN